MTDLINRLKTDKGEEGMVQSAEVISLFNRNLGEALSDWARVLAPGHIMTGNDLEQYNNCTSQTRRHISAALKPDTTEQLQEIVRIANRHEIPLYPVSTGKNWGFGGASPVVDHCVVIDLSRMNRIVHFDSKLGLLTIEPGVTQQQVVDFLDANDYQFLIPVICSSPNCSLLANTLERGFGMVPNADRFMHLMSLKAVLPNGDLYQSLLSDAGGERIDQAYKWGVGPYLDGLFSQGNFGIVTQVTLSLSPKTDEVTLFFFRIRPDTSMEALLDRLRDLKHQAGGIINTIELGNRMDAEHGMRDRSVRKDMSHSSESICKPENWYAFGTIHANKPLTKAAISTMKSVMRGVACDFGFIDKKNIPSLSKPGVFSFLRSKTTKFLRENRSLIEEMYEFVQCRPQLKALYYAYHRFGAPESASDLERDIKKTGLIWHAPAIPAHGKDLRQFLECFHGLSQKYNLSPNWQISMIQPTCVQVAVHIFFDPETEREIAYDYYKELFEAGREMGYLPVRLHIDAMPWMVPDKDSPYLNFIDSIKRAIDPKNIMMPGRFTSRSRR